MAIKKALVIYGGSIEELHSGDSLGASGDVTGPSASTDNAIARFDGTTGKLIQDSTVSVDDDGNIQNANSVGFDLTPTTIPTAVGAIYWDEGNKTPSINLDNDVTLQLGQEIVTLCYNGTGSTITNGSVVSVIGAQGQRPSIALADADSESSSSRTLGIATEDIANGAEGFITTFGFVRGLDTSSFTAGDAIYLSQTAGQFTATKPTQPAHLVHLGYVIKVNASSGEVFVTINNGWELNELHDVLITDPQENDVLTRIGSLWKNMPASGGGFSNMDIITASTTWNVPTGVTKAKITVVGGGGGGSGNKTPSVNCGAFGGNGGVAIALVTGLSGSYTITIGAGGAGGAGGSGTSTGGNGGDTSFGSILSATGGTGANGATAGTSGTGTVSSGTVIRSGAKSWPLPYEVAGHGRDRDNSTAIAYSVSNEFGAGVGGDAGGLISATAYAGGGGIGGVVIIEY